MLLLLGKRFGPLPGEVAHQVEAMTPEQLRQLTLDILDADSLDLLGLGPSAGEPETS